MMNMEVVKPAWLEGLMAETFFATCGFHEKTRKNEKNVYCLNCCVSICSHCLPSHTSHPLLQVRRYVYHDVVRLGDLKKLMIDSSYIQPYTINSAKVIFLKQRPQSRTCKGSANVCFTCDRILQDPYNFCSLSCKVDYLVYQDENLSSIIYSFNESDFAHSQFERLRVDSCETVEEEEEEEEDGDGDGDDDNQITASSLSEDPIQCRASTCFNDNTTGHSGISQELEASANKKTKGNDFLPGFAFSLGSRRKNAPHRAPLS